MMLSGSTTNTSRKHGKKELRLFFHCGSFDHPHMQSLNDCKFVFLVFMTVVFQIPGACNTTLEMYFQDLSSGVLKVPQIPKI